MEAPFIEEDVDFKEMYLKMVRASEEAIRILIETQQECEEMYIGATEPRITELRRAFGEEDGEPAEDAGEDE